MPSIPENQKLARGNGAATLATGLDALTFYQLAERIARNWYGVDLARHAHAGFAHLFWRDPQLRDMNRFRADMSRIRRARNDIAHMRNPLTKRRVTSIVSRTDRWSAALINMRADRVPSG